ncbi:pyridoxamine 5'-phosphate oxidase family protein [Carbonactinospora thermoautotrophica]|uniref:pyridoxamine 5'-phosphate oxidase family protein n=1 Tax=Carbonactinospora thermoautotrophica TaxID=1469144 RepID=UPI000833FF2F|nr:pyridoxamine 5'-phosphate oxidase family protein [Carbonactinospora thermoautotrophica]MCX9193819.1 pyridoxamine 5'-phosphate oxidase family protein [Carbonactinospora thermoautotrophica]
MAAEKPSASVVAPLRGEKRWAYLTRAKTIRVASVNEDGTIYLTPLWFVVDNQRIYIPLDAGSRHGANVEAGRPLSALVDAGDEYATVSGVRIIGSLRPVDDAELVNRLEELVFEKYFHVGHPYAESYFEFREFAGGRFFELVPDKMIGWDSRETTIVQVPESRVLPDFVQDRILPS